MKSLIIYPVHFINFLKHFVNSSPFISTEDAKRLAIKEEQYDPGYEDAYGGAYVERGPEGSQAESQSNGHCTFSSAENTGKSFR